MLAYFDCFSGISGDMTLGAFIDLGVPVKWLKERLSDHLALKDFDLSVQPAMRHGLTAQKVTVSVKNHPVSRDYTAIEKMIRKSALSTFVKETSLNIFEKLAMAESDIHNVAKEKIHFHEVGGVDAVVDIVGTALCIEYLGIVQIHASKIPLGSGFVKCEHGTIPIPSPATVSILKGVPVYDSGVRHEIVTPTGAAIIAALADQFGGMPEMVIHKIGMGAGTRDLQKVPNLLRIMTGELSPHESDSIIIIETCIDDMNPEIYGFLMDRLLENGALDVYWIPVHMKKNRPGTKIQVLCHAGERDKIIRLVLSETTSTGVRFYEANRRILKREQVRVNSRYGQIEVKRIRKPDGTIRIVPEYEVCKTIAREKNIPILKVYRSIIRENED